RDSVMVSGVAATPDSISGDATLTAWVGGSLDHLKVGGKLTGSNIYVRKDRAKAFQLDFGLRDALANLSGDVKLRVDSVTYASIPIDTVDLKMAIADSTRGSFSDRALAHSGDVAGAAGRWTTTGTRDDIKIDTLGLQIGADRWRLAMPANYSIDND